MNREDLIKYLKRQTHEALIDGKPSDEKSLKKYQNGRAWPGDERCRCPSRRQNC